MKKKSILLLLFVGLGLAHNSYCLQKLGKIQALYEPLHASFIEKQAQSVDDKQIAFELLKESDLSSKSGFKKLKKSWRYLKKAASKKRFSSNKEVQKNFLMIDNLYGLISSYFDLYHAEDLLTSMTSFYDLYDLKEQDLFYNVSMNAEKFQIKNLYDLMKRIKQDQYRISYMLINFNLTQSITQDLASLNHKISELKYHLAENEDFKGQYRKVQWLKAIGVITFICLPVISLPVAIILPAAVGFGIVYKKVYDNQGCVIPALQDSIFASLAIIGAYGRCELVRGYTAGWSRGYSDAFLKGILTI